MTVEQLRQVHHAQPFRPFRIHLADSRHLDVEHPEFLAYNPTGRTVIVTRSDDTFDVIDVFLVTSIEVFNGQSRRKPRKQK